MDFGVYMPSGSADQIMQFQAVRASNLAGVSVPGFKAEIPFAERLQQALAVQPEVESQPRYDSRQMPLPARSQTNFTPGPMKHTGRGLDVAIPGKGWLVVDVNGVEMLTRNGQLEVTGTGEVLTAGGLQVMGLRGPVVLPEYSKLTIGTDGVINIVPRGGQESEIVEAGRFMLVNPPEDQLQRQTGGMFRYVGNAALASDPDVEINSGVLEGANTDSVAELMDFLALGREFEMNVRMMAAFSDMTVSGDKLLHEGNS
ncbi:flagellar basal body rod protein FlgF [Parendozoicomonas sp. Alg238-R29]|uniref:flagellar basal body rod protein FlgF n=1 Tax=Parendozoicomonas sp. Alg238-R29 TaxID=2993446 RepID=UPI00248D638B|nr:flagellar basal body rod protein FlgF [Parendozoicomonas sp. Alg238-R29]